jgi:hypothetical protein
MSWRADPLVSLSLSRRDANEDGHPTPTEASNTYNSSAQHVHGTLMI